MKAKQALPILILTILLTAFVMAGEIVEKIYAVVNEEIITYSEIKQFEQGMIAELKTQLQGEELEKTIAERKANLLNLLIERKLVLSKAKEKNYDVEQYLEIVIKEIMKENNIPSLDELKKALATSGIEFAEWRQIRKDELLSQSLIQNEIGSKILVGNAEMMEYYRNHQEEYTRPAEFTLNCIFLNKDNYFVKSALNEKKAKISAKLKETNNFGEVAQEYSELPNPDNKMLLGTFKKGELDAIIENTASSLKKDEYSDWIETSSGWYIIQLAKFEEAGLIAFKDVRDDIQQVIKNRKMESEVNKYIEQLKKESHIKIYHEYK